jgi:hypothetical protein
MKGAAGWASNVASYVRCRGHEKSRPEWNATL